MRRGSFIPSYLIAGILAVLVLVAVVLLIASFFGGKAIPFFDWLPDFKRTSKVEVTSTILRYDLQEEKVQHWDGTQWADLQERMKLGKYEVYAPSLVSSFSEYAGDSLDLKLYDGKIRFVKGDKGLDVAMDLKGSAEAQRLRTSFYYSVPGPPSVLYRYVSPESPFHGWLWSLEIDQHIWRSTSAPEVEKCSVGSVSLGKQCATIRELIHKDEIQGANFLAKTGFSGNLLPLPYAGTSVVFHADGSLSNDGKPIHERGTFETYLQGVALAWKERVLLEPIPLGVITVENREDLEGPAPPYYYCLEVRDGRYFIVDVSKVVVKRAVCGGSPS